MKAIIQIQATMDNLNFNIKLEPGAFIPTRATPGSAGYDLYAYLPSGSITLKPGEHRLISSGVSIAMSNDVYGHVVARSGLALKNGIITMAGIIDSDYRNVIGVILYNKGPVSPTADLVIENGMRIAQIIFHNHIVPKFNVLDQLDSTTRGTGGFGSTGI
jgi:dUTP pyrophosphatase